MGQLRYYKLGQVLLQIGAAITNYGNCYYKIGKLLQIGAKFITNWGITVSTGTSTKTRKNIRKNIKNVKKTRTTSSAFSAKQTLSQSVHKAERSFSSIPRKNAKVIGTLAKKTDLRIAAVHDKSVRKKNELNEKEEEWK